MNCFSWKIRRARFRPGLLLCWCLLALAFPVRAQTQTGPVSRTNRAAPERFLIIIESSSDMQKRATNVQRSVGLLLSSTLREELHRGDTIGLWTYDLELHTGEFPLQHWTPTAGKEIIIATVQFIQQLRFAKQARLAPVMAQLDLLVAESDKLTVMLLSSGSEAPVGTPFDAQIAEVFKLNAAEQRRKAMPFVTILRAIHGKFVSFKVNTPPWPFELPASPVEPATVVPTPAEVTPPPKAEVKPPPPPAKPIIVLQPPPAKVEPTNAVPPPSNPPAPSVVTVAPVKGPTNPPATVVVTPTPVKMPIAPAPMVQTNSLPPPPSFTNSTAATVQPETRISVVPILIGAGTVLVGIALWCLVLGKRSREQPRVSLITRSMNKDEK